MSSPRIVGTAKHENADLALEVEAVDRLDQAEARDLEEVVEGLLGALVAARELARERQEALDEHLAVDRVALVQVAREERAILLGAVDGAPGLVSPRSATVTGTAMRSGWTAGLECDWRTPWRSKQEYERRGAGAQAGRGGSWAAPATALYSPGVR